MCVKCILDFWNGTIITVIITYDDDYDYDATIMILYLYGPKADCHQTQNKDIITINDIFW